MFIAGWILSAPLGGFAAEGGSLLPNLNPFKSKGQAPTSARGGSPPTSGWKMPDLWPFPSTTTTTAAKTPKRKAGPSTWQKVSGGTSKLISETADTLNPFNDANDNQPQGKVTGSSSMFRQASASKKQTAKSKSFLPSLFGSEEEQKPKTVNEFLMQPRPDF